MIKIAVDAMGGDHSVETTVKGAQLAVKEFSDIEIYLYGDREKITPLLTDSTRIVIVDAPKFMSMGEHDPIGYLRNNKDCSLAQAFSSLRDGTCDCGVTAGPTQCVIVATHLFVRRMEGMSRVGLCPVVPGYDGKNKLVLDVGANTEFKPEHLQEFAIAGTIISREIYGIREPKVGLLNIGTEEGKGREVDQQTYDLLKSTKAINFFGNVESSDLLTTECNVLVSDGFTGNMVIKSIEGTAKIMGKMLKEEFHTNLKTKVCGLLLKKNLKHFKSRLDSKAVGGAMIIGAKAPIVKAHGSSDAETFKNAIKQARLMVLYKVIDKVKENLPKEEA